MSSGPPALPRLLRGWPGARAPRLVLALDYDGTLTPIVQRPELARPDRALRKRLQCLASLAGVTVMVISGRELRTLGAWLEDPALVLIGSQGGEWRCGRRRRRLLAPPGLHRRLASVSARLRACLGSWPGALIEEKYASVAVHYRNVPAGRRRGLLQRVKAVARFPDMEWTAGKCVRELRHCDVNKGAAFVAVAARLGLSRLPVLAAGDDRTDEDLFSKLGRRDLSILIGRRRTGALRRTRDPETFSRALDGFCRYRQFISG